MNNKQTEKITKEYILELLKDLVVEINALGEWNLSNALKLSRLNLKRHELAGFLVDMEIESATSIAYGTDETNRDIAIAQNIRPKRKGDAVTNESHYFAGIRHLRDEVEGYTSKLKEAIEKEIKKPD